MEQTPKLPIVTSEFSIDRNSYCKARLLELCKRIWFWLGLGTMTCGLGSVITDSTDWVHSYTLYGLAFFPALGLFGLIATAYKILRPKSQHIFQYRWQFEFSEDKYAVKVEEWIDARYSWAIPTYISVICGWTFFYNGQQISLAIPDSAFQQEDLPRFHDLIKRKRLAINRYRNRQD